MSWTEYDEMEAQKYGGLSSEADSFAARRLTPRARTELNYFLDKIYRDTNAEYSEWSEEGKSEINKIIRDIRERKTAGAIKKNLLKLSKVLYRRV